MKQFISVLMLVFYLQATEAQPKLGEMAPEISLPDAKDSVIRLSSFKGKVVLLDFWASWCGPCRRANPGVVKLYDQYRSKGFEVVGISLDDNKRDWLKAVRQDNIRYTQVIDLLRLPATAGEQYKIRQIPTTFLLDKKGKIMGVDLESEKLEQLIKQLL